MWITSAMRSNGICARAFASRIASLDGPSDRQNRLVFHGEHGFEVLHRSPLLGHPDRLRASLLPRRLGPRRPSPREGTFSIMYVGIGMSSRFNARVRRGER